ncbi:MAG TPA: hypothetical protein GX525_10060 [Bacilli bacterium]|nr:hypothetical protein [Bacilli bacterium]
MKQFLAKYSKQELTMLVLFVLMIIWLFSILSTTELNIEESQSLVEEETSLELVLNTLNEYE